MDNSQIQAQAYKPQWLMCDIINDSLAHDFGLHCATVVENKQKQICL